MRKTAVLLLNLGTPRSPGYCDVARYLSQFLTDHRVIDLPWWQRQLLVRGWIVPSRLRQAVDQYRKIWTPEGSPLLVHAKKCAARLQERLGSSYLVRCAMRYQNPSIPEVLEALSSEDVHSLIVVPQFPQYASATTGSAYEALFAAVKGWWNIPRLVCLSEYCDHPRFIAALVHRMEQSAWRNYDQILFSFHGLPERQIKKGDPCRKCFHTGCCRS